MFRRISAVLLGLLLLTSCGGGGGGGGGSNSSVRFTADRTSVDLAYDENAGFMPTANVTVTATGNFSGTLYIGAIVEGQGIDPNVQAVISGTQAMFTLRARSGLPAGTYNGRVQLLGCRDASCNSQLGNSPVIVSYVLTVRETLQATPATVTTTAQSGSTTSSYVNIRLPTGATTFDATVTQGEQWITIDQLTAAGFNVSIASLPEGTYHGSVRVAAGTAQIQVQVNHTVAGGTPRTDMQVSPNNLALSAVEGAISAPVMLNVTPPSWNPVTSVRFTGEYSETDIAWLTSSPVTGGHNISVNATDLEAGTYTAWARVAGAYPSQEVVATVAVTVGPGFVRPADVLTTIGSDTTAADLDGTVPVDVVDGPVTSWSATSSAPWLVLTDAAGATGETLAYQIDEALLRDLANGVEHVAQVTVTPQRTTMTPVTFDVRVSKRLAAVTSVGPYIQPAGRDTRVILRGLGFDSVDDLDARLQFDGGTVAQITRVNDTELVVHADPLPQGSWTFSFTNALDQAADSAQVRIYTPQVFAEASTATGGAIRGLFYDAERSSVYAVNVGTEALQRFHFDGTQWQLTALPVPAILSAGLTQDGSRLLVASSANGVSRIRQQDAADMNDEITMTDIEPPLYRGFTYLDGVIHTTNDGRSWLTVGTTWNDMAYFDAATEEVTIVNPPMPTSFYSGPWYAMSRDGERLMVPQSGSISPAPPALYLDAADSVVRANPAGLTNTYRMSLSDDGSRYMHDNYSVRDRDFALIGNIPDLGGYFVFSSVLSPDGSRLYGLAYPPNAGDGPARVYVFDTSASQPASSELDVLGHYDLAEYPSCFGNSCDIGALHMAITPDGNNLFVAGNERLLVLPAASATLVQASGPPPVLGKPKGIATTPWHLNLKR